MLLLEEKSVGLYHAWGESADRAGQFGLDGSEGQQRQSKHDAESEGQRQEEHPPQVRALEALLSSRAPRSRREACPGISSQAKREKNCVAKLEYILDTSQQ